MISKGCVVVLMVVGGGGGGMGMVGKDVVRTSLFSSSRGWNA